MTRPRIGRQAPRSDVDVRVSEICSRCSPSYFHTRMKEILSKTDKRHRAAIESCIFGHYISIPKLIGTFTRVEALLRRFNANSTSFRFGPGLDIPFTAREFSLVIGLRHVGQPVHLGLKIESSLLGRLFSNQFSNVNRGNIYSKLLEYSDRHTNEDIKDFVRLYILFLFNTILFPMSNYSTPRFLIPYIDDLSSIDLYAWGDATFDFLLAEIKLHLGGDAGVGARKRYFDGCSVGLMALVYEHIPSFGVPSKLRSIPRLFCWAESKIPNTIKAAEQKFDEVNSNMVVEILPFPDEASLLSPVEVIGGNSNVDRDMFERLLKEKEDELIRLREKICDLEGSRMEGVHVEHHETMEVDKDECVERARGKEPMGINEEISEDIVEEEERAIVPYVSDEHGTPQPSPCDIMPMPTSPPPVDDAHISDVVTSIVKAVQTRHDRTKKDKGTDFVTPPGTTTPLKKRKVARRHCRTKKNKVVEAKERTHVEQTASDIDFEGSEYLTEEERRAIQTYLGRDDRSVVVWDGPKHYIHGEVLCDLLFGKELRSDLVDCYLSILCSPSISSCHDHEIWCMQTHAMWNILSGLQKKNKKRTIKIDEFPSFLQDLLPSMRLVLEELTAELLSRVRYLIIPLHECNHWWLLVFNTSEKTFIQMNSVDTPAKRATTKVFAKFLSDYLFYAHKYDTGVPIVTGRPCNQQDGGVDCGVYLCLWAECFARDTQEFWDFAKDCNMKAQRARMAARILTHRHGLLHSAQ